MTVRELSPDQLQELKSHYYWGARDALEADPENPLNIKRDQNADEYGHPDAIPDEDIFEYYEGIYFVPDDFFG